MEKVCDKLRKMSEASNETLQVVFDFDKTLTKPTVDGEEAVGSLEIFKIMNGVPVEFLANGRKAMMEYYKIIKDPSLNMEKRLCITDEFLSKLDKFVRLVQFPDDSLFKKEATKGKFILREGTAAAFEMLKEKSVPIVVLSGGLTSVINAVLKSQSLLDSKVHVIANSFKYKDGRIDGFKGDIVHFYNKSSHYLKSEIYGKELFKRENVIIMGDAVADALMTEGVPDTFNVLKIGFCHENLWRDGVEDFMKAFDIVISEDETMNTINALLQYVLASSETTK